MTKKILSALLACAVALSLAACGSKPPTVAELVEGGWPSPDSDLDANVTMAIGAAISSEALGISGDELSGSMEMGLGADVHLVRTSKLSHSEGTVTMSMFGMSYDAKMDEWTVTDDDGTVMTYTYDSDVGDWVEGSASADDSAAMSDIFDVDAGDFTDLVLKETDDAYVVKGRVEVSKLAALGLAEMAESVTGSDVPDGAKMDVVMTYDKSPRALRSLSMAVDPRTLTSADGVTFSEFSFEVVVNATSGVQLSLPAELQ